MSEFQPSNDYKIDNTIYQIFIEEDQNKKQYLLQQLNYYNQYKYYIEECAYNFNNNIPLPTPPTPPTPPPNSE
jgi:hypothetical protein